MADDKKQTTAFDTDRQYLGGVYAKALLGLAAKHGKVDQVIEELDSFVDALQVIPKLRHTLESPRVPFSAKEQIVQKAVGAKACQEIVNFLKVVCRKGRADCLSAVRDAARAMHDEMSGRVQATMTTAVAVDDVVRKMVVERLSTILGKQVTLTSHIDPDIIGGLLVRVGDTVFDGSLTNQLKQIRTAAIGRANQEIRESLDRFASEDQASGSGQTE